MLMGYRQRGFLFGRGSERFFNALTPAGAIVLFFTVRCQATMFVCKYMHDIGLHLCVPACTCACVLMLF